MTTAENQPTLPGRRIRRRVTLTDIATACGIAPSTVSRAMSNPNRVSAEMYERIVRKARELGYESALVPAAGARTARGTIALVLPNLTNPFNLDLIRGCQIQAQAAGFHQLLVTSEESEQVEANWLAELSSTVDGIILASPRSRDDLLNQIGERIPLVVLNREIPWTSGVVIDTPAGSALGVDYLASLGHRRIAYARGPATSWTDAAKYKALRSAAARHDAEVIPVGAFRPTLAAGAAAADAVILTNASAAIFFNDTLAIGALGRFHDRGISVPEQLSVIGCDDIFGSSFTSPPLTTVTASGEQAGRAITDMLLSRFTTRDRSHRIDRLPTHLTVRESTGPARPQSEQLVVRPR
jgi:DNA-binding LacI/PurR family transcriptional regulator